MNTDLQKYTINSAAISDDLFGKEGAQYELTENKSELIIAGSKIAFYFSVTLMPLTVVMTSYILASLWYFGSLFSPLIFALGFGVIIGGVVTFFLVETFFSDSNTGEYGPDGKKIKIKSPYATQRENIALLWERRKKLNRFLSVESERYDHSQAREIAPLLLARIRKHNKLIESGIRMIGLQETLDRNSNSQLAPALAEKITEKVKVEYHDLRNRIETYEVMKEMTTDMSLDITVALMDIKDFNKSDLDAFLTAHQETIGMLLEDNEKPDATVS